MDERRAMNEREMGRMEADMRALEKRFEASEDSINERLKSIEGKVQEILDAANMGKGAWWLLLKIGAVMSALAMAAAWVAEQLNKIGGFR